MIDCCRYGKRVAIAYAASRLPATYGTTLRVFSEVLLHEGDINVLIQYLF